ncbi:DUF3574 domain-containing protein [Acidomonas methanolica]|uniref:DUF3574 domain-containing protein n=1 Tax=Acidomonas methanolica TaxID=437 RepID=UPI002119DE74|nr:DUF3574 domain-containing protein [Acidomonas methanolica]MCQ9154832.1 DUF3574 domain-containing protein [Acidomonas methanolica]
MKRLSFPAILLLAGCAATPPAACPLPGMRSMLDIHLMFGLTRPDQSRISEAEWDRFLAATITPAFPDGLSVLTAEGQWRDRRSDVIGREASRLVRIVTPPDAGLAGKIEAIRAAYKAQFAQQSVGLVIERGCADF